MELNAYYEANQVVIEISDDGRGLDFEAIRLAGVQRGLLSAEALPDRDTLTNLIFQPGFSTALSKRAVSGRGVGLIPAKHPLAGASSWWTIR